MNIRIFILNCWLLPRPFSVYNTQRLDSIISLIKKIRPDIIALQEVWLNRYVKKIEHELKDYLFIRSGSRVYNKSGLMTGLLMKHKSHEMNSFPTGKNHSLSERIAEKGYHLIELPGGVYIVNTHLYAPQDTKTFSITKRQFESLSKKILPKQRIIVGDLNLELKDIRKTSHATQFSLPDDNVPVSKPNPYTHFLFRKSYHMSTRVDHILKTKNCRAVISKKFLYRPVVSDHFIMLGTVRL
ncbi:MAG: endonuclease/exonuclease/phosphatase family protein [Candidatus Woesearchaeota archaeon]